MNPHGAIRAVGAIGVMAEQCTARSPRGVVAAAAPVAAGIGARLLERGGNAFDAAVGAALAETVLLPPKCGLGGDLVAIVWEPSSATPETLIAVGGAPAGLAAMASSMQPTGPLSVGVPTAALGYHELARRGRLDLADIATPAIDLATNGFCWSTICTVLAAESRALVERHQPEGTTYYPDGALIEPGAVVRLPGLAVALESFVSDPDGFLVGPVGQAIVERVRRSGGVVTIDDLAAARAEWRAPASTSIRGVATFATPTPTHGASLLDALERMGDDPDLGRQYESVTQAITSRSMSLSDTSGTSMVSAVDAEGRLVVIVHSNSFPRFGSGLIVEQYDLILANRAGRGFSTDPDHPNFPVAGRRPATTLHAWAFASSGWRAAGATPGGANQMPWNAQTLATLLPLGASGRLDDRHIAETIVGPRWQLDPDGGVTVERGFPPEALSALAAAVGGEAASSNLGDSGDGSLEPSAEHERLRSVERWALRSAMQIVASHGGRRLGVADPRTVGMALPL